MLLIFSLLFSAFAKDPIKPYWKSYLKSSQCLYSENSKSSASIKELVEKDVNYKIRFSSLCSLEHANALIGEHVSSVTPLSRREKKLLLRLCFEQGWNCDGSFDKSLKSIKTLNLSQIAIDDVPSLTQLTYVPSYQIFVDKISFLTPSYLSYIQRFGGYYPRKASYNVVKLYFPTANEIPLSSFQVSKIIETSSILIEDMESQKPKIKNLLSSPVISNETKEELQNILKEMDFIQEKIKTETPLIDKQKELSKLYEMCNTNLDVAPDEGLVYISEFLEQNIANLTSDTLVSNKCTDFKRKLDKRLPEIKARIAEKERKENEYIQYLFQAHVQRVSEESECNHYLRDAIGVYKCLGEGQSFTVTSPVQASGGCISPKCSRVEINGVTCTHSPTSLPTNSPCFDWQFLGFQ